ncbi:hypothetical protein ACLPHM_12915 [Paenalcaligenes sp. Me131]|uniref:hypothetical protein n=1 Tax=Paenalcaligenes TaxID=1100891 RepID=UPI00140B09FC|nr:hypothetical protein [Paenalcaligenes suwonensis]NHC60345.1 hypothetical protein [Paenalcaligenes suwonensis]
MSSQQGQGPRRSRLHFHIIMAGSGLFIIAMLAVLAYVMSRPQTPAVQAAEQQAILKCRERSVDPSRSLIAQQELAKSCQEMTKQYVRKFGQQP